MKVMLMHYAYPPSMGGVEILLQEQAHILANLRYDVTVLTGSGEDDNPEVKVIAEPKLMSVLQQDPALQKRFVAEGVIDETFLKLSDDIRAILEKHVADQDTVIVHNMATLIHNLPFLKALKAYVADHPEQNIIIWAHDQTFVDEGRIKYDKEGVNLSPEQKDLLLSPIQGVRYVTISRTFRSLFSQIMGIPEKSIVVIPNGINLKRFYALDDESWKVIKQGKMFSAYPLLFSPVNILQRKNVLYCLDIVAALKKSYPNLMYVVTGKPSIHRSIDNHYEELIAKITEHQLEDHVLFLKEKLTGSVSHSLIKALYSLADAVLYFSKQENFGLPILESLLFKTPIFTSHLAVFKEIGEDYLTYIDYTTTSPATVAQLIHERIERDTVGILHAKIRKDYNLERITETLVVPLLTKK
jgi:glycosyltransferase involved in cell wall biosynthesis